MKPTILISSKLLILFVLCNVSNSQNTQGTANNSTNMEDGLPPWPPSLSKKTVNITDADFKKMIPLIRVLPKFEQDIIAECYQSNTDTTRFIDPDCYISKIETIKSVIGKGIGNKFTNNSKERRNALSCITKMTQEYADMEKDTSQTTNVMTDVTSILGNQATLNSKKASFLKIFTEYMLERKKFLITTWDNINSMCQKNSEGEFISCQFVDSPQNDVLISSFKDYAKELNNFATNYNQGVIDSQTKIGKMDKCRPRGTQQEISSSQNDTPQRNIPAPIKTSANNFISEVSKQASSANWETLKTKIEALVTDSQNIGEEFKTRPRIVQMILDNVSGSGKYIAEFRKVIGNQPCSQDYQVYCSQSQCSCVSANSGCPSEIAKTQTISLNQPSRILQTPQEGKQTDTSHNQPRPGDQQRGGPKLGDISRNGKPRIPKFEIGKRDTPKSFYISTGCLSNKRFLYAEGEMEIGGKVVDFIYGGQGLGPESAKMGKSCAKALFNGTDEEKKGCRGSISEECRKNMDGTCKKTGLYNKLQVQPPSASPYPPQCDDSLSTYSETSCLDWLVTTTTKGSITLHPDSIEKLQEYIATANNPQSLRLLQTSDGYTYFQLTSNNQLTNDSKANLLNTEINSDLIKIDDATADYTPDANNYALQLNVETDSTVLSGGYIKLGMIILSLAFIFL